MTYKELWLAKSALTTLGELRVTKVALRALRIFDAVEAEFARFIKQCRVQAKEADIDENEEGAFDALVNTLMDKTDVPGQFELDTIQWKWLPPDSLNAFEIMALEDVGVLEGRPVG